MRYFLIIIILFLTFSCADKPKFIPAKDLKKIIIESVMVDSYVRNDAQIMAIDGHSTLDIFRPIVEEMGYTAEDFQYTYSVMVMRKTNVFGYLMDEVIEELKKNKEKYSYYAEFDRVWEKEVKEKVIDTLYFSPDSIIIKSIADLNMINYLVSINEPGDLIVKYNYITTERDSNSTRYMTYQLRDSLTGKSFRNSNFWLGNSKGNKVNKFSKEIKIHNSRKANLADIRILSHSPDGKYLTSSTIKSLDMRIDSVTILFRPNLESASKRLKTEIYSRVPILLNLDYQLDNKQDFVIPYNEVYGSKNIISVDSVRYDKQLPYSRAEELKKKNKKK